MRITIAYCITTVSGPSGMVSAEAVLTIENLRLPQKPIPPLLTYNCFRLGHRGNEQHHIASLTKKVAQIMLC
jgi:hypothetical protein